MDRMTPPPNYYGAPFPCFNQGGGPNPQMMPSNQPPMPNGANINNQVQPDYANENYPVPQAESYNTSNKEHICMNYSYAEIAHANRGKHVKVYCSFPDSTKWHDVVIEGKIHYAADDHILIETLDNPNHYIMIVGIYVNYMELYDKPIVPNKKSMLWWIFNFANLSHLSLLILKIH